MPDAAPERKQFPTVSIVIATRDDDEGAEFTSHSTLMYSKGVNIKEVIIVDNNPGGPSSKNLKGFAAGNPVVKYEPFDLDPSTQGLSPAGLLGCPPLARNHGVRKASGDVVVSLDSHVLLTPESVFRAASWLMENPKDMVQGGMLMNCLHQKAYEWNPGWNGFNYGTWRYSEGPHHIAFHDNPYEIQLAGVGFMAFVRENFPMYTADFVGWGAEEGYIHEKVRRAGGRCMMHPGIHWWHRFNKTNIAGSKGNTNFVWTVIYNYLVGFAELDDADGFQECVDHFKAMDNKRYLADAMATFRKRGHKVPDGVQM